MKLLSLLTVLLLSVNANATSLIAHGPSTSSISADTWYTLKPLTVVEDVDSGFNTTTGEYTVGTAGLYDIECVVSLYGTKYLNNGLIFKIYKNGSSVSWSSRYTRFAGSVTNDYSITLSSKVRLAVNDVVTCEFYTSVSGNSISSSQPSVITITKVQ